MNAMNERLSDLIGRIPALDNMAMEAAAAHQNQLTKPPGSLGLLEDLAIRLAGITGTVTPEFKQKAIIVMAGDHGVCAEGISAFPAEVTPQMVMNFLAGGAAVNVLGRQAGAEVICVDVGVNADLSHPQLQSRKVRRGTGNMAQGQAMTREEAEAAILAGVDTVDECVRAGIRMFSTGEMGIGNTTPSAAILCALTGLAPEEAVGRGTGIGDAQWAHKCEVVRKAIEVNQPDRSDALDVLAKVGGLEIAGLTGVILGAAAHRLPVVVDGFISSAAALAAVRLAPAAQPYLIASHLSEERGHAALLAELGLKPGLHLNMRLGEGTGGALMFPIIDASLRIMQEMATFAQAGVSNKDTDDSEGQA